MFGRREQRAASDLGNFSQHDPVLALYLATMRPPTLWGQVLLVLILGTLLVGAAPLLGRIFQNNSVPTGVAALSPTVTQGGVQREAATPANTTGPTAMQETLPTASGVEKESQSESFGNQHAKAFVAAKTLNLRSAPAAQSSLLKKLSHGEELTITGNQIGQFYPVRVNRDGSAGWVLANGVATQGSAVTAP
jgi:hypothetical protein